MRMRQGEIERERGRYKESREKLIDRNGEKREK